MMPRPPASINLRVDGLTGTIADKHLVKRITWAGEGGELWGVLGANGAGKSTFLGLLSGTPRTGLLRTGTISCAGSPLEALPARERARLLAYLPQHPETPPTLTVAETVLLGRSPYRSAFAGPAPEDTEALERALERMDLGGLRDRLPTTLSGGERQRMHFARILAQDARIWLLDEPYGHLDFAHQARLLDLLVELAVERGLLIVLVAHDLFFLPRAATHLAVLHEGELLAAGPTATVWTEALAERAFGVPFVREGAMLFPRWRAG